MVFSKKLAAIILWLISLTLLLLTVATMPEEGQPHRELLQEVSLVLTWLTMLGAWPLVYFLQLKAGDSSKEEKLKRLRTEAKTLSDKRVRVLSEAELLEQELLDERDKQVPGPHRKAAGISTDD